MFADAAVQVAEFVRSCVVPSLSCPVTLNCTIPPTSTDELAGLTVRLVNVAELTVKVTEPLMPPEDAVIVVEPAPALVATPDALITATEGDEDDQLAPGKAAVLPSENVPVALNC
jgi:hypothetical protein